VTVIRPPGFLVVLSGPSGAGKTTFRERLLQECPGVVYSVSATTRSRRSGEQDGHDYWYLTRELFETWVAEGRFVETAVVHGHWYGTPRAPIDKAVSDGLVVLLDVDVQGGESLRRTYQ
jgi:guanylate kinase